MIRGQDPARFKLTLAEALEKHELYSQPSVKGGVQVFHWGENRTDEQIREASRDLRRLTDYVVTDYVVTSSVSGPSLILVEVGP